MRYITVQYAVRAPDGSTWSSPGGLLHDRTLLTTEWKGKEPAPSFVARALLEKGYTAIYMFADSGGNGITDSWSRIYEFVKRVDAEKALLGDREAVTRGVPL